MEASKKIIHVLCGCSLLSPAYQAYNVLVHCKYKSTAHLTIWEYVSQTELRERRKKLTTKRTNLGVVPAQNRNIPSSVKIRYAQ